MNKIKTNCLIQKRNGEKLTKVRIFFFFGRWDSVEKKIFLCSFDERFVALVLVWGCYHVRPNWTLRFSNIDDIDVLFMDYGAYSSVIDIKSV